jgi:LMBR1 domain-containing protein 1
VLVLSTTQVKAVSDPREAHPLSTTVSVLSLSTVLLCCLALPLDVYLVSSAVDYATGLRTISDAAVTARASDMQAVYNALYAALLAFTFVLLPFAYFYYEEEEEGAGVGRKVLGAAKFTLGFVFCFVVLIVIGLLMRPSPGKSEGTSDWVRGLLDTSNRGQGAIYFTVACVMLLGTIGWTIYAGYGLSAWPIGLIRGQRSLSLERTDVDSELGLVRAKSDAIKYKRSQSKKDKNELDRLLKKERLLKQHTTVLDREAESWLARVRRMLRPFAFLLGVLALLFSMFLMTSLALGTIDRAKNSKCGMECGWTLNRSRIPNPLDIVLVEAHRVFPADYAVFAAMLLFFFAATFAGISRIGIRFAWILIYRVRARRTLPQGVLLTAMVLNFLILTLSMQVLTLAPQYATFGYQSYIVPEPANGNGSAANGNGSRVDAYAPLPVGDLPRVAQMPGSGFDYPASAGASAGGSYEADALAGEEDQDNGLLATISDLVSPRRHPGGRSDGEGATDGDGKAAIDGGGKAATDSDGKVATDGGGTTFTGTTASRGAELPPTQRALVGDAVTILLSAGAGSDTDDPDPDAGLVKPCRRDAPANACQTTRLAHFISKVSVQMPFFGLVFFYQNWAFLGMFFIGLVISVFKARPGATDGVGSDDEDGDLF